MVNHKLENLFPNLSASSYHITSPPTWQYNCVAWAAKDTQLCWGPSTRMGYYWPRHAPTEETVEAFISAFAGLGFALCDDDNLEPGFEKIAICQDRSGNPTHVARQLPNGKWTSKLGFLEDIEHELKGLTGSDYGEVAKIMKKQIP
jgi:hypothetical protein